MSGRDDLAGGEEVTTMAFRWTVEDNRGNEYRIDPDGDISVRDLDGDSVAHARRGDDDWPALAAVLGVTPADFVRCPACEEEHLPPVCGEDPGPGDRRTT